MANMENKESIKNLTPEALREAVKTCGESAFRAKQIERWLWRGLAGSFDEMTDLSKSLREKLAQNYKVDALSLDGDIKSADGTRKFIFGLDDGGKIESALIPADELLTLCVSSQCGCALACGFCLTGRRGLTRNLTPGEILDQIILTRRALGPDTALTNIVMMGMGEPLMNFDSVSQALKTITGEAGMGMSYRRITVSTSGIIRKMGDFGRLGLARLAVSLNSPDNEIRSQIMPVNKKNPLPELMAACRRYPLRPRERITFEYVMLDGVNDAESDARALAALVADIPCKINLIPFNEFPGAKYRTPPVDRVERFRRALLKSNIDTLVRQSRGADISAACGCLGGE
jgi:23S rRNA (adenine2503-C2)-methyltransferase